MLLHERRCSSPQSAPHLRCLVFTPEVIDATRTLTPAQLAWLDKHLLAACALLRLQGTLEVKCIDDAQMIAAHDKFLGIPETTDVMTFDAFEATKDLAARHTWRVQSLDDDRPRTIDASLLVCVDVSRRQAKTRLLSVEHELLLYILHGVLHCLGWNDEDDAEFAQMHALEDAILRAIGVGNVFGVAEADKLS